MIFDVIILGAGASGLMCAAHLKESKVALIDHNPKIGAKIKISGGGKCNVTNEKVSTNNYWGDAGWIEFALSYFTSKMFLAYLHEHRLFPTIRSEGQYFFTQSAQELIDLLHNETKGTTYFLSHEIKLVEKKENFHVVTDKGVLQARHVVVATGGQSYATVGASGIGYEIARSFGHTVTKLDPALVGFTVQKEQFWMKELSGINMDVSINVADKEFRGALLFAHKGISGPTVLNTSLYWQKGKIMINFLPDFDWSTLKNSKKSLSTILPLPKRFVKLFLEAVEVEDKPYKSLQSYEQEKVAALQHYTMAPAGTFGMTKAEVTRGGIATDQIENTTMQSKRVKGLYFIGEVLDVTGELGGYNFQWAFSSATVCAKAIKAER